MKYTITEERATPAVVATDLRKAYGDVTVLDGVSLRVERGRLLALLGPNGAGKTTTVRILATLVPADGGEAAVDGHDVRRQPAAVRRSIGLTGQFTAVDELLTGRENLVMVGRLQRLGRRRAGERADELLDRFGLAGDADRRTGEYSGGMRRRLDLAASLVAAPPVLFLDEPTTGLDPRSRAGLWAIVRELLAAGTSVLLTTQYLEEADQLADRVALIDGGRVVAEGTPAELKRRVGDERLDLVLARPEDAERAGALVGGTIAEGAAVGDADQAGGATVSVAVHGADDVRRHLDALATAGIPVERLALAAPTLDDVFLALTGTATSARPPGPTLRPDTDELDTPAPEAATTEAPPARATGSERAEAAR